MSLIIDVMNWQEMLLKVFLVKLMQERICGKPNKKLKQVQILRLSDLLSNRKFLISY